MIHGMTIVMVVFFMIGWLIVIAIPMYHETNPTPIILNTIPAIPHTTSATNNCRACLDNGI